MWLILEAFPLEMFMLFKVLILRDKTFKNWEYLLIGNIFFFFFLILMRLGKWSFATFIIIIYQGYYYYEESRPFKTKLIVFHIEC